MGNPSAENDPVFIEDSAGGGSRPGGLTFICVAAIALGGAGLLMGCFGLMSQVFTSEMQQGFAGFPGGANMPGAEAQKEMNARLLAVANRYKWVTLPLLVVKVFVEAALLAGGLMSWGLKPRGRSWLLGGLCAATVFDAAYVVPTVLVQRETQAVMSEMMPKLMAAQQGRNAPPGMNDFMSGFMSVVGIASTIVALVWLAGKVLFYMLGIRYLRKPEVRALFAQPEAG
jgi:hypothetical protein